MNILINIYIYIYIADIPMRQNHIDAQFALMETEMMEP